MGAGMGMRDVCAGIPWVFAGVGRRVLWVYDAICLVVVVVGGELWGRREVRREWTGGRDLLRKRREREGKGSIMTDFILASFLAL